MEIMLGVATFIGGLAAAWYFYEKFRAVTKNGLDLSAKPKTKAIIKLKLPDRAMSDLKLSFGMLYVRDGKDQSDCRGFLQNEEVFPLTSIEPLTFEVNYTQSTGFQFKHFVDYREYSFSEVKFLLEDWGFSSVTEGDGKAGRAWFISPKYEVCTTNDAITNNFYYPV